MSLNSQTLKAHTPHPYLLQLFVLVSHVAQLSRAHESEVGRVEEKYRPLAFHVCFADLNELAVFEGGSVERFDLAVNDAH